MALICFAFIFLLAQSSLAFNVQLQAPWERYPTVSARFAQPKHGFVHQLVLTATADDDISFDDDGIKDDAARNESSDNHVPAIPSPKGVDDLTELGLVNGSTIEPVPTVRSCLKPLLQSCRPSNFFGVVLFHLTGTYLGLTDKSLLLPTLKRPSVMLALLVLLGVSSVSMVINDYYDVKSGVDAEKTQMPLVHSHVPLYVVRRFLNYCYALLLLGVALLPGAPARVSAVTALMLTYWYTKHLKPKTWIKNIVCAIIMSFAPVTSASVAVAVTPSNQTLWRIGHPLWRLCMALFCGFMAREIAMDVNDVDDDRSHHIETVPVKYGRKVGCAVSLSFTVAMSLIITIVPAATKYITGLTLGVLSSATVLIPGIEMYNSGGEDIEANNRYIEIGKLSVVFLLASFV